MSWLLTYFVRLLPGAPRAEWPSPTRTPLTFPMLDGGVLVYADLAAHLVDLPGQLRKSPPEA